DLKDKILSSGVAQEISMAGGSQATIDYGVKDEAVGALTMLGFSPAPSAKIVVAILKEHPDMSVEQVIKAALKQIK
ncbi:MAG: Holliday junction branch migration protein RuvA, partial [Prevotella sp.]|nr:Holliday junction branch migration protein RuvA [Prevotella sp.]